MKMQLMSRAAVAALAAGAAAAGGEEDPDAGPAPAPSPAPAPAPAPAGDGENAPEASTAVMLATDAAAAITEARTAGAAEANTRWGTVFASTEAQANPSLAAFLLGNSNANAESIVTQLKAQGGTPAPAATVTEPVQPAATIPNTAIDIGAETDAAAIVAAGATGVDGKGGDVFDVALANHANANAPLVPAVLNAQGHIVTPAVPRTGN